MHESEYRALISDIDGTLTPLTPNALPSEKVVKTIKEAVEKGLLFSLATGRPFFLVKYLIDHLGNIAPSIVDNGAVIVDSKDGSVLWEAILPRELANEILDLSVDFKLVRASCDTGGVENPKKISIGSKVRKISIHDISLEVAEEMITKVSSKFKEVVGVKAASYEGSHLVDIYFSNVNATKQYAVFELSKILGLEHHQIIGVGDGHNDFSLLMASGLKVAMGNAVQELKDIADYIAPTVGEDGLSTVIEKYFLEKL